MPVTTQTNPSATCTATTLRNHGDVEGIGMPATVVTSSIAVHLLGLWHYRTSIPSSPISAFATVLGTGIGWPDSFFGAIIVAGFDFWMLDRTRCQCRSKELSPG